MNKTVDYQGYKIESVPHRLDDEKWRLHICISVEDSRGVLTRQFAGDSIYATEQGLLCSRHLRQTPKWLVFMVSRLGTIVQAII